MSQSTEAASHSPQPAGWYSDPLDPSLQRYFDGSRWTFWTTELRQQVATEAPLAPYEAHAPTLRSDILQAKNAAGLLLLGAGKEIAQLEAYLVPEERVLALTSATGDGIGVLACTNQRLLFIFVGLLRSQHLAVNWNETREIVYDRSSGQFEVFTVRRTKRATPALSVRVPRQADAERIYRAAQSASAAPRIDMI